MALAHLSEEVGALFPYGGKAIFFQVLQGINFSLNLVKNKGAAWGLFSNYPELLVYSRLLIVLILFRWLFKKRTPFLQKSALSLIIFGAIGNLIDYFQYGYVVDMFHMKFYSWDFPVFNVADSAIFIGVVLLFFSKGKKA